MLKKIFDKVSLEFLVKISVSVVLAILIIYAFMSLDPDLGWHLRMGQLILHSGIPKTDPFSYTMPSFPFVDHEWLSNVYMWVVYSLFGKAGLVFVFLNYFIATILVLIYTCFKIHFKNTPKNWLFFGVIVLVVLSLTPFFGIRTQVQSWLFLSIEVLILTSEKMRKKWFVFLPLLILVWTNLHGSFAVGVLSIAFYEVVKMLSERKINYKAIFIIILNFAVTLINPYGIRLWGEVWQQLSDHQLTWRISEWIPSLFVFNPGFWFLVALSIVLFWKYRKRIPTVMILFAGAFFMERFQHQDTSHYL